MQSFSGTEGSTFGNGVMYASLKGRGYWFEEIE